MEQGPTTAMRRSSMPWRIRWIACRASCTAVAALSLQGNSRMRWAGGASSLMALILRSSVANAMRPFQGRGWNVPQPAAKVCGYRALASEVVRHAERECLGARPGEAAGSVSNQADARTGARRRGAAAVLAVPGDAVAARADGEVGGCAVPHVRVAHDDRRVAVEPVPEPDREHVGRIVDRARAGVAGSVRGVRPSAHHLVGRAEALQRGEIV